MQSNAFDAHLSDGRTILARSLAQTIFCWFVGKRLCKRRSLTIIYNYFINFVYIGIQKNVPLLCLWWLWQIWIEFYRAKHVVLAWYCYRKSSVRQSVCLSVCLHLRLSVVCLHLGKLWWYRGRMCRVSSKIITRIISLGSSLMEPQHRQSSSRGTPLKFGRNKGGVALLRKPAISLKRGKIGPRKSHTRFRLVPKSTTLDDLEGDLRTLFQNTRVFRSPPRKCEWR